MEEVEEAFTLAVAADAPRSGERPSRMPTRFWWLAVEEAVEDLLTQGYTLTEAAEEGQRAEMESQALVSLLSAAWGVHRQLEATLALTTTTAKAAVEQEVQEALDPA